MNYTEDDMNALLDERRKRYKTSVLDRFPPITSVKEMTYVASYTWSLSVRKARWLAESTVIEPFGYPQTAGEIARDYLTVKFPKRLRAREAQRQLITLHRAPPLFAMPRAFQNMAMVDLKSAYWSILNIVGWDVDYWPGVFLHPGTTPFDYPGEPYKTARVALVTAGLSCRSLIWTGEQFKTQNMRNQHINYGIWSVVQDTLHACAQVAIRHQAIYVHTDGYIVPMTEVKPLINDLFAECRLVARVKNYGAGEVYGIGCYDIGGKKTARKMLRGSLGFTNLSSDSFDWLKGELCKVYDWRQKTGILSKEQANAYLATRQKLLTKARQTFDTEL
jgi:hypothetical protein